MALTQAERGEAFRELHEGECFLMPNPWDQGSARILAALGFKALATTSLGFALTLGRLDGGVSLDEVVEHVRELSAATDLPLSVDLENGYGDAPEDAANAITRAAEAGAVGGSIEDYGPEAGIYERDHAAERIAAAVEAARALDFPFTLTARAENHFRGVDDIDDTIARLLAYEAAGADVLYAPRLASIDQARAICEATTKPVNVLAETGSTFAEVAEAGVSRISVGGRLALVATDAFAAAATAARDGDFSSLKARPPLDEWLS